MKNDSIRIVYNTAGNNKLGMGHIYTSLRISDRFYRDYKATVLYLLQPDSKPSIDLIKETKHMLKVLDPSRPERYIEEIRNFQADVVINDLLYVEEEFMKSLRNSEALIVNIENIKEPKSLKYADIIFNTVYPPAASRGRDYYYGPEYAPLREVFKNLPKKKIDKDCKNFYIAFGGSDSLGFTIKAIETLDRLEDIKSTVLLGAGFNHGKELEKLLKKTIKNKFDVREKHDIAYINRADIGLISGGYTIYELAATGTPSLALSHNKMEEERLKLFSDSGLTLNIGNGDLSKNNLLSKIKEFMKKYKLRRKMSKKQQELVDGCGLDRIVKIIINKLESR